MSTWQNSCLILSCFALAFPRLHKTFITNRGRPYIDILFVIPPGILKSAQPIGDDLNLCMALDLTYNVRYSYLLGFSLFPNIVYAFSRVFPHFSQPQDLQKQVGGPPPVTLSRASRSSRSSNASRSDSADGSREPAKTPERSRSENETSWLDGDGQQTNMDCWYCCGFLWKMDENGWFIDELWNEGWILHAHASLEEGIMDLFGDLADSCWFYHREIDHDRGIDTKSRSLVRMLWVDNP